MGGGGSAPKAPKFKPVDTNVVGPMAKAQDIAAYNLSDTDFANRMPMLKKGRESNIQSAITNITGGSDPQVAAALKSAGVSRNLGSTEFQKAKSLGQPVASLEQRDRDYFSRMLADNPQRTAGLSGKNVAQIAISNATGQNAWNQAQYGTAVNQYNASQEQGAQNTAAIIAALSSVAGAGIRSGYNPNYLAPGAYGSGQAYAPNPSGVGYDLPGGITGGYG